MQHPDVPMHLLWFFRIRSTSYVIRNKAQGSNLSVELPGTTENKELKEPKCCNDGILLFAFFLYLHSYNSFISGFLWASTALIIHLGKDASVTSISSVELKILSSKLFCVRVWVLNLILKQ